MQGKIDGNSDGGQQIIALGDDDLHLFSLKGLLPAGQALSVNTTYLIVSLVSTDFMSGNPILLERPMAESNIRLLLPLLESPYYCPQEVLLASLLYPYGELLAGLFSSDNAARTKWQMIVAEQRLCLQQAQAQGTWKKELKPLYNALSRLRSKLHPFGLEIAISSSYSAYRLVSLHFPR
jgi:hypothetical protein